MGVMATRGVMMPFWKKKFVRKQQFHWCCGRCMDWRRIRSWKCLQPGDQMQATKQMGRFAEQVKSVLSGGSGSRSLTVNGDTPYKDAMAKPFRFCVWHIPETPRSN